MNVQNLVKVNGPLKDLNGFMNAEARNYRLRDGSVFFETESDWIADVDRVRKWALEWPALTFRVGFVSRETNYRGVAVFAGDSFRYHEEETDLSNIEGPIIPRYWMEEFEPPLDDYFK